MVQEGRGQTPQTCVTLNTPVIFSVDLEELSSARKSAIRSGSVLKNQRPDSSQNEFYKQRTDMLYRSAEFSSRPPSADPVRESNHSHRSDPMCEQDSGLQLQRRMWIQDKVQSHSSVF